MSADELTRWPEGWAILFAAQASGGRIPGKVRAMKYVAALQRDGFPIENRFINAEMGPYDEAVHASALALAEYGFLRIEEVDSGKEKKRIDYHATEAGRKFCKERIIPLLNSLDFQSSLRHYFRVTRTEFRFRKTDELVKKLHKELYLDDVDEFRTALSKALRDASALFKVAETRMAESCPLCLHLLGSLEYTRTALERVSQGERFDPYSGKNHILYNAEKLLSIARGLIEHDHIDDPRISENSALGSAIGELRYRLHCIEWNSQVYGVVPALEGSGPMMEPPEIL